MRIYELFGLSLLFLFLALSLTGCQKEKEDDSQYLYRARDFYQQNKFEATLIELKNALRVNPSNSEARWMLGKVFLQMGNWAAAETELRKAVDYGVDISAVWPQLAKSMIRQHKYRDVLQQVSVDNISNISLRALMMAYRAEAYWGIKMPEKALLTIKQAVILAPESNDVKLIQSRILVMSGESGKALDILSAVVSDDPANNEAWLWKGRAERSLKNYEAAIGSFDQVIESAAFSAHARLERALVYIRLQKTEEARKDLEVLEELAPDSSRVLFAKGFLNLQQDQLKDAQLLLEESLRVAPEVLETELFLGVAHAGLGNYAMSEEYLVRVVARMPENIHARKLLARIYFSEKKYEQAEQLLVSDFEKVSQDKNILLLLGKIKMSLGAYSEAIPLFKSVVENAVSEEAGAGKALSQEVGEKENIEEIASTLAPPLQAKVLLVLAMLSDDDLVQAAAEAQQLQKDHPDMAVARTLQGVVAGKAGKLKQAMTFFKEAIDLNEADPLATNHLANLYLRSGQHEKARQIYEAGLKKYPLHPLLLSGRSVIAILERDDVTAKELLTRWVKRYPRSLTARLMYAQYLLKREDAKAALNELQRPPAIDSDHSDYLRLIGEIYYMLNAPASSANAFAQLVSRQPRSVDGYLWLARTSKRMNQPRRVREFLMNALEIAPDNDQARKFLVENYLETSEYEQAEEITRELIKKTPYDASIYLIAADVASRQKKYAKMLESLEKAYALRPNENTLVAYAKGLAQQKREKRAVSLLLSYLKGQPQSHVSLFTLSDIYTQSGQEKKAIETLSQLLNIKPDHVVALNNLAWLLRDSDIKAALGYAQKAHELLPQSAPIADTYASLLLRDNQKEKAFAVWQKFETHSNLEVVYNYAKALYDNGQSEQARRLLKSRIDTDNPSPTQEKINKLLSETDHQ